VLCCWSYFLATANHGRRRTCLSARNFASRFLCSLCSLRKKAPEPIIPPLLISIIDIRLAITVLACAAVAMFDVILFAPLFMQTVLGVSATDAGIIFCLTNIDYVDSQRFERTNRQPHGQIQGAIYIWSCSGHDSPCYAQPASTIDKLCFSGGHSDLVRARA